jgi:hypothetical protein
VAVGDAALYTNSTGSDNVAVGQGSLLANTTASLNVGVGYNAGIALTSTSNNTFVGANAGNNIVTGSNNIMLGSGARGSATNVSELVIGYDIVGKGNATGYIYAPGGGHIYQGTNASTWAQTSDVRLKKNIVNNDVGLAKINAIQVRNFDYKTAEEVESDGVFDSRQAIVKTGTQLGVIAQELELICPDCVTTESTGVKTVSGDNLHWHMLNAIKELSATNDALAARITTLEGN